AVGDLAGGHDRLGHRLPGEGVQVRVAVGRVEEAPVERPPVRRRLRLASHVVELTVDVRKVDDGHAPPRSSRPGATRERESPGRVAVTGTTRPAPRSAVARPVPPAVPLAY